ncbi:type IV pilus twitching motility protein PilT [Hathewaya limosa]|uniref:Twitching motility protein PilT n=1 Tax=Hathewaya limosa TaxID=1536 RepID=A0ABU0JSQ2_HATLI|nr:type IV pilus twitching motility protein PilT [Hathewaya limosa]MDQ0478962.1 twitching motility protein PilT [Hathewaya limosa]
MIKLDDLLEIAVEKNASDIHLTVGAYPYIRVNGELSKVYNEKLTVDDTKNFAIAILNEDYKTYETIGEIDTTYSLAGLGRFRVNIYKQRSSDTLAIRIVGGKIPTLKELNMPTVVKEFALKDRGLILVTGPTGSGKSTTLAALINEINNTRSEHIITLEKPIEFLYKHNRSIVNQREMGRDSENFETALKTLLREDPDVVFISELNTQESISIALTAAENGRLVLSSMNTMGVCKTIERIIEYFPPYQQEQVRIQLSNVLQGVVSQQLIPRHNGEGRILSMELMTVNPTIQTLIREGKIQQIESIIQTGNKLGMKTMDMSLVELYKQGEISKDIALTYAMDKEIMLRMLML